MLAEPQPAQVRDDPRSARRWSLEHAAAAAAFVEDESGTLHVLRYADVERLLMEPRLAGIGLAIFDRMGVTDGPLRAWYGSLMFTNEGVPHNRLRRLVGKAFSPRSVEGLRPRAAALVAERLSPLREAGEGDLLAPLGDVAMQVMCTLLGVPAADVPAFIDWVTPLSPIFGFMREDEIDAATSAITALLAYVDDLCERRERTPGDDLITALIAAEDGGDRLSREETVAMVANLLVGGHDTTSSQIGCTLFTLLPRPDILALAREAALRPSIVNETIRYEAAIRGAPRTVVDAFEIGGAMRRAGSIVVCSTTAANRDPAVWARPDQVEPRRFLEPDAPRLLTFGGGPHHCLGAWLARLTLEETVAAVSALAPTLTVEPESIEWVQSLGASPQDLPVTLAAL